ncbi:BON domain-containing protein [Rhodoferax sp.]|uniref:BON domain-containing protein n=1 Tax=Rhodoferax sp. TaxID=50421 RepID=UPI0027535645|nr:BON domain-containing protein [Rhodoferax sp.]
MNTQLKLLTLITALAGVTAFALTGCGKVSETTGAAPPSTSVGTEIDDGVITARARAALLSDPDIKSLDLKVDTHKGVVQLSGFVDDPAQVDRAMLVVRAVAGVTDVQNKVDMKGLATTVGNKVDDSVVTTAVKAALLADARIKSLDIAVVTRKGEVQLSGFVDNQGQIDTAIELARAIDGVRSVNNEMSVKK